MNEISPHACDQAICAPGRIRTCDTRFRRAVLYPLSYEGSGRVRPTSQRTGVPARGRHPVAGRGRITGAECSRMVG